MGKSNGYILYIIKKHTNASPRGRVGHVLQKTFIVINVEIFPILSRSAIKVDARGRLCLHG